MSRSSSGSWAARAPPSGDIIDLDQFMRGARPDHRPRERQVAQARNGLVVDGGSLTRVTRKASSSSITSSSPTRAQPPPPRAAHPPRTRDSRRDKRFSHDSGLSDGSYVRRRHRPHRRVSCANDRPRAPSPAPAPRPSSSSASLRAFRTACEQTLRDQQQAITRVAQLCERLTERREQTTETSGSSSSRSTADPRRKDKHRTEECKTYKIILTKLNELNRLFAVRGRSPPPPRPRAPAAASRACDSLSGSVSVSNKKVATEPERKTVPATQIITKRVAVETKWKPSASRLVERAVGSESVRTDERASERASVRNERADAQSRRSTRLGALRAVTNAHALDIAPREAVPKRARGDCPNVLTESVVKCESSNEEDSSSACDVHCGFDLDNPVHLYAQAKRLQALHATTHRRALSAARSLFPLAPERARARSLCSAWRGYWRALRRCLAAQLCVPTDDA